MTVTAPGSRAIHAPRVSRRRTLGLLSGAGATVLVSSHPRAQPAGLAQDASQPRPGGTLRIAQIGDLRFFNPGRALPFWAFGAIYDSLLRYDSGGNFVPHLAESYEVSDDNTTVTITLHSGVTFHSGAPSPPRMSPSGSTC